MKLFPEMWRWLAILAVITLSTFPAAASSFIQLISQRDASLPPVAGGGGSSQMPIVSADGRYILFASTANNLTLMTNGAPLPASTLPVLNVFLRDCASNTTTLVSVDLTGTGGGNGNSLPFGISTNGQFVLFESSANNLAANNDTNSAQDIFVRDVVNGTTTLVSVNTNGVSGSGESRDPVMTPDGRYVAFTSAAPDLVSGDTNNIPDVFVRDLQANTTTLVSVGATPSGISSSDTSIDSSEAPEITPDGRYVAFYSTATNLVSGVTTTGEIYVRDLVSGNTTWASAGAHSLFQSVTGGTNEVSCNFSISADGQYVGFETCTNPPSGPTLRGIILRYELQSGLTDLVYTNAVIDFESFETIRNLDMTPDGRFIAFVGNLTNNPYYYQGVLNTAVYLWDAQSGSSTLVSPDQTTGKPAAGICDSPVVSTNGQYVAFLSSGTNLVANPLNGQYHVYLRDVQNSITTLQDVGTNGAGFGVISITVPSMSSDGSVVAFESGDDNNVPGDGNPDSDVFELTSAASSAQLISVHDPSLASVTPNGGLSGVTASSLSTDGRYMAYFSEADNVIPNDTNGYRDVFVRDMLAGTDTLVSVNTNGVSGGGISSEAAITGDSRYVVFTSSAGDLVANGLNTEQNVYVYDMQARTTTLVSVSTDGIHPGNASSYSPIISANGRYVLFRSLASNLAAGSFSGENLFLRDLQIGTNYALTTLGSSGTVYPAAMTPDGRYVAVWGSVPGNSSVKVYVWNTALAAITYSNSLPVSPTFFSALSFSPNGQKLACLGGTSGGLYTINLVSNIITTNQSSGTFETLFAGLQFSADGRFLTYAMATNTGYPLENVYLYDSLAGTNMLISQNSSTLSTNGSSDSPAISPDGRFIAYRSAATGLIAGSTNGIPQMIVYDQWTGSNTLLSTDITGTISGDNRSFMPVFSGDSRTLVFSSWASNLATNDFNHASDVFAFAFLYANVTPGAVGQGPTITWSYVSGHSYQVEYKNNLTDSAWQQVSGTMSISGNRASMTDPAPASGQRFYRVVAE